MSDQTEREKASTIRTISKKGADTGEISSQRINRIGDILWLVDDERGEKFQASFKSWGTIDEKFLIMQRLLLYCSTGGRLYSDENNRITASARKTFLNMERNVHKVLEHWRKNDALTQLPLHHWSRDQITTAVRDIFSQVATRDLLPSYGSLQDLVAPLKSSFSGFSAGDLTDGIVYRINQSMLKAIVDPMLAEEGVHFSEYVKGKRYSSLPITHAMVGLAEAVRLFDSEQTKFALALFSAWRDHPQASEPMDLWKQLQNGDLYARGHKRIEYKRIREFQNKLFASTDFTPDDLPWKTWGQFTSYIGDVVDACVFVLLVLTGIRSHELLGLRVENWEPDTNGVWYFRSAENKVNAGGLYDRAIVGLGARAFAIVKNLGWLDPELPRPLFGPWYGTEASYYARSVAAGSKYKAKKAIVSIQKCKERQHKKCARGSQWPDDRLKAFYKKNIVEKHPELAATHPDTHPHQCRHTWAEVPMRYMDPKYVNISAGIREQFRHGYQSWMEKRYSGEKIDRDVQAGLMHDYTRELIERITFADPTDPFMGPAVKRIMQQAAEIEVLHPDDVDHAMTEYIDSLAIEIEMLLFEWGFCMKRKGEEKMAACYDPQTSLPNPTLFGEKLPELCFGCPHRATHAVGEQVNVITRLGISWNDIAKNHPIKMIGKIGEAAAKKAENVLKERSYG
jgi:integrase